MESIVRASELATEEIRLATGVEPRSVVAMRFHKSQIEQADEPISALKSMTRAEVASAAKIKIDVRVGAVAWHQAATGNPALNGPVPLDRISLQFDGDGGVLEIHGSKKTWTEGVFKRMKDELSPIGFQVPVRAFSFLMFPVVLVFVLVGITALPGNEPRADSALDNDTAQAVTISVLAALMVISFAAWILYPTFELIGKGHRSRASRWGKPVAGVVVTLLVGIAGSAIFAALS